MNANTTINSLKYWATECDRTNMGCQASSVLQDAAALIESLQSQLAASARREKAAVDDLRGICSKCDWRDKQRLSDGQLDDKCKTCYANNKCNWQWRGPSEGE